MEGIDEFIKVRDAALLSLDDRKIAEYCKRYSVQLPADPETRLVGLHKARTAATSLPMGARSESKRWLYARGYASLDDGDVPV